MSTADQGWRKWDTALPGTAIHAWEISLAAGDVDASTTSDIMLAVTTSRPCGSASCPDSLRLVTGFTAADGTVASWGSLETNWSGDLAPQLHSGDIDGDARSDYVVVDVVAAHIALSEKTSNGNTTIAVKPPRPDRRLW